MLASLLVAVAWCSPSIAGAAAATTDDGIHVDPNSPPGVEYALPLQAAREQAGAGRSAAGNSQAAGRGQAFGVGIEPGSQAKAGAGTSARRSRPGRGSTAGAPPTAGLESAPSISPRALASVEQRDGGAPVVFSLAGIVVVALLGGLVALLLRRRRPAE